MALVEATRIDRLLPDALPSAGRAAAKHLRAIWIALVAIAMAVQAAGLLFVLFDAYQINPALRAIGIQTDFDEDDRIVVTPLRADVAAAGVTGNSRIVALGGRRFSPDASSLLLARSLMAWPGDKVPVIFHNPDGREIAMRISRSSPAPLVVAPIPIPVGARMIIRFVSTFLSSLALLASSLVLLRRRPKDPEAILFGFAFLLIATTVDPPLLMWLSIGAGWVIDVLTGVWWTLLVIALAAFPSGTFTPRAMRWTLPLAPVLGLVLAADQLGTVSTAIIGVGVPLILLAMQVVRYRRLVPGRERQQIKWAALGFALGFILVGVSLAMSLAPYDSWAPMARGIWLLATISVFNIAFVCMPLGLLVSLIRYRLWDVDRIITRSAAVAIVTGLIALTWAAMSDLVKQLVASLLGEGHAVLALGLGAALAASIFGPTQKIVVEWSKRRFDPSRVDLERLPERVRGWSGHCTTSQLAARILDIAVRAVHAPSGVVLGRTPTGRTLLASRGLDAKQQSLSSAPDFMIAGGQIVHLEDEDGLAGWLILAPREDGSPYPKADIAALSHIAGPVAAALRQSLPDEAVFSALDELQARLARLERGAPSAT